MGGSDNKRYIIEPEPFLCSVRKLNLRKWAFAAGDAAPGQAPTFFYLLNIRRADPDHFSHPVHLRTPAAAAMAMKPQPPIY